MEFALGLGSPFLVEIYSNGYFSMHDPDEVEI